MDKMSRMGPEATGAVEAVVTPGNADRVVAIGSPEIPSTPQLPQRFTPPSKTCEFRRRDC